MLCNALWSKEAVVPAPVRQLWSVPSACVSQRAKEAQTATGEQDRRLQVLAHEAQNVTVHGQRLSSRLQRAAALQSNLSARCHHFHLPPAHHT